MRQAPSRQHRALYLSLHLRARGPRRRLIAMRACRIGVALLLVALAAGLGLPLAPSPASPPTDRALVEAVDGVSITVRDMERAIEFYSTVLFFEKVSDVLVSKGPYGQLLGVAGARLRVVRMRLGD